MYTLLNESHDTNTQFSQTNVATNSWMNVLVDPAPKVRHLDIHPRISRIAAANPPGHNSGEPTPNGQRTTGVTVARALTAQLIIPGADLTVAQVRIVDPAQILLDYRHRGCLQLIRTKASILERTPSADHRADSRARLFAGFEEADRLAAVVELEGLLCPDQAQVVGGRVVVVVVGEDLLDVVKTATFFFDCCAGSDCQVILVDAQDAVTGGQDVVGQDDGATADEFVLVLEGYLPGMRLYRRVLAPHDSEVWLLADWAGCGQGLCFFSDFG